MLLANHLDFRSFKGTDIVDATGKSFEFLIESCRLFWKFDKFKHGKLAVFLSKRGQFIGNSGLK